MMGARTISKLARHQALRAARAKTTTLIIEAEDLEGGRLLMYLRHLPNVGTYRPKGWKLVEHCLVDKTGKGAEYEPALTARGLLEWVRERGPGFGYAIIEEGVFQMVVGRFEPIRRKP